MALVLKKKRNKNMTSFTWLITIVIFHKGCVLLLLYKSRYSL